MRVLFNATCIFQGGGVRRTTEFARYLHHHPDGHEWHFVVSQPVDRDLPQTCKTGFSWQVFDDRPSRSKTARKQLLKLESEIKPDAVLTIAGPAYCQFSSPHLMGWADGWVSHADALAYASLKSLRKKAFFWLTTVYKKRWIGKADHWFIQTESAKRGLSARCSIPLEKITVIPNTAGSLYQNEVGKNEYDDNGRCRIFIFSAAWPQKRLEIVPNVIKEIRAADANIDFEFVLTLDESHEITQSIKRALKEENLESYVTNLGSVPSSDGPKLYRETNICFLPSVLETFSGVFPEAMAMGRPIVTTDLGFARDVCKDAAAYFRPDDPKSAAEKIISVIKDKAFRNRLIACGTKEIKKLPTTAQQRDAIVQILESISRGQSPKR